MPDWMREGSLVADGEPKRRSLVSAISKRRANRMAAGMLRPDCPVCGAEPGAWCDYRHQDFGPGTEMLQLDTELLVCSARVQIAIDARWVKLDDILKQVPDWSDQPGLRPAR